MRSDGLNPETLARLAAQLNPQLACDDPAKAIELARNLLLAADLELAEEEALRAEGESEDKFFPRDELISVAEAFKALPPGHYKTEAKFAAALRKENLTRVAQQVDLPQWGKALPHEEEKFVKYIEVTAIRAVNELFSRQHKAKQESDRARKAASRKQSQKNVVELQGQKAERNRRKAEPKKQKAESTKQKAERSESA